MLTVLSVVSVLHLITFPDITDLGCLGECSGLERLDLSFNDVTKLYALAGLTNLTDLNLSANRITSLGKNCSVVAVCYS